jgi:Flp pilus assembly pilin Flp
MLALYVHLSTCLSSCLSVVAARARADEHGQASAEYALVLLGAAAVALLIVAWATKTNLIGKLLDAVMGAITDKVK